MAEETQNADLQAAESKAKGMAALGTLSGDAPADAAPQVPAEPKIDNLGRSYATGRRKDAAARVWVKRGTGQMTINCLLYTSPSPRDVEESRMPSSA